MTEFTSFMQSHGENLIANGYPILPIQPGTKIPGRFSNGEWFPAVNWQRHCERATKKFEFDLWSKWPGCAVGLACGKIIGIDIDVYDNPNKAGYPIGNPGEDAEVALGLERLAREMLGDTPAMRIGKAPKRALYYRSATPFPGKKMHPIEVYGLGQQMVIYAMHPDTGRPYEWPEESLADIDISRLPEITEAQAMEWMDVAFRRIPDKWKPKTLCSLASDGVSSWSGPSDPKGTYEAVASALEFIPNNDLDGSSWIMICNAIKAALGPAGRDLWVNWSRSSAKSGTSGKADTAEKRYDSARPTKIGAGTIYYLAEQRGWVPEPDITLNGTIAEASSRPHQAAAMLAAPIPSAPRRTPPAPLAAVPVSPYLMDVGGIIGDIVKLCNETAISPQPFLALAAALCCVGTLAGRKFRTRTNLRTNLYAIGIADSGGGKDHARNVVKELLFATGLMDFMGGGKIASGSGLLTALERHPCRLFLLDEMGKFVKSVTGPRVSSHREEIWTNLTELYTSAGGVFLGAEYSDQKLRPRIDIVQPCCSVYGVTVPGAFWSALEAGAMHDGSLARFLLFVTDDDYPQRNKNPAKLEISEDLISALRLITQGVGGASDLPPMPGVAPDVYTVPSTPEADVLLDQISDEQVDWLRSTRGTSSTAAIARVGEQAAKLAMIRAISDCPTNPVITAEHVTWGMSLADHCTRTLIREADRHIADNETEAAHKRVLDIIRKSGTITQNELTRRTQSLKGKERVEIINALAESGQIVIGLEQQEGAGRPSKTYTAIPIDPNA
jgi:hypothetical protein